MKLYAFTINGQAVGVDLPSWDDTAIGSSPPFKWSSTPPTNYVDISSMPNFFDFGQLTGHDYKFARDQAKAYVVELGSGDVSVGFDLLSNEDKVIAAQHNIGTHTQQVGVLGIDTLVLAGQLYAANTYKSKEVRLSRAISEVYNRLNGEKEIILDVAIRHDLFVKYLQGVDGTVQGDPEGVTDYIDGVVSTSFASGQADEGLRHKTWSPTGMTMGAFCDLLNDILIKGEY